MFGSSGGAVAALTWVATYPDDVATALAHEPPSTWALPNDAEAADRAFQGVREAYQDRGFGAGMATFMALTMWPGEFTDDYFAQPPADPAMFGMPTDDDGSRDDMLLSERAITVTRYAYDLDAIKASPTRVVLGVGEETGDTITARTARGVAEPPRRRAGHLPQPPRRLRRRRPREPVRRQAGRVRRHAAPGARRRPEASDVMTFWSL